jgi:hypothetical protein
MDDKKIMIRAANQRRKAYLIARINEILDDYLMDDKEDFCRIDMEFRKGKETQEKHLLWERITE